MTNTSCIEHLPKMVLVIVRQDYVELCTDEDIDARCAAAILNLFEFWTNIKINSAGQAKKHNDIRESGNLPRTQDEDHWIWKTTAEIKDELLSIWGTTKIEASRKWLVEHRLLMQRNNPDYKWDKTYQYKLNIDAINLSLRELKNKGAIPETTTEKKKISPDGETTKSSDGAVEIFCDGCGKSFGSIPIAAGTIVEGSCTCVDCIEGAVASDVDSGGHKQKCAVCSNMFHDGSTGETSEIESMYGVRTCDSCYKWLQVGCPGLPPREWFRDKVNAEDNNLICTNPECGGLIDDVFYHSGKNANIHCPGCWIDLFNQERCETQQTTLTEDELKQLATGHVTGHVAVSDINRVICEGLLDKTLLKMRGQSKGKISSYYLTHYSEKLCENPSDDLAKWIKLKQTVKETVAARKATTKKSKRKKKDRQPPDLSTMPEIEEIARELCQIHFDTTYSLIADSDKHTIVSLSHTYRNQGADAAQKVRQIHDHYCEQDWYEGLSIWGLTKNMRIQQALAKIGNDKSSEQDKPFTIEGVE